MNNKPVALIALFWTLAASALTTDDYIAQGRSNLVAHAIWNASASFNSALTLSPTNEQANALVAATRLLVLPQTPAGSNFLNQLGFAKTNRDIYNWSSEMPVDTNGSTIWPTGYNSANLVAFYRTNIMVAIAASATNLANIKSTSFNLALSLNETTIEDVTLDYGDVQLLRALLAAGQFAGYTVNAQNVGVIIPTLQAMSQTNGLTIQAVLAAYPSLLTLASAADLTASKGALTNAIALYFAASDFIRNSRNPGITNQLFILQTNEVVNEANFRSVLTNVLLSLNGPTILEPHLTFSINASNYFSGAKTLRSLLPQFYGDSYMNDTLPDYTFGGILLNEPAYLVETALRKGFYSYAGIYGGVVYDNTFNDPNAGYFAAFVGTNQQVTVVGYDHDSFQNIYNGQAGGVGAQFSVDKSGNWLFSGNSPKGVDGNNSYGYIGKDGSFNGGLQFTNGDFVQLNGYQPAQQSPLGPFQNAAGNYSGTWSGGGQSGTLQAVLTADGYILFCVFANGAQNDGGIGQFGSNNQFTNFDSASGSTVIGTLNNSTFTIAGTFNSNSGGGSGTWTMTRSAKIPFDVPPVITTNLPLTKTIALGSNVVFSLSVTGSPPLCYQWYFNSNAIPLPATNTLTVSNNLWTSTGTYYLSAAVNNAVGGTNSQQITVTVTPETVPPTIVITSPTPGQSWSNSAFTVTGTASDNVAVAYVYVSLTNSAGIGAWTLAAGTNNWNLPATLAPGTNTVFAYAVDASGNVSTTNKVGFNYVVSAPLTVQMTGRGTVSPNYSNAVLQVGANYSMTAAVVAGSGFAFTNWTGGTSLPLAPLTNGATLQFIMQSNLVLQANFVDTNKPVLSITNLVAGQRWSNLVFTAQGTATDNWQVASVQYRLNGGSWSNTTGTTNWSVPLTLTPGTNTFAAYATDTTGNNSATNSVNFQYVVTNQLQVSMTGLGTISPNYSNVWLEIGRNYSITSAPAAGFTFTNWTSSQGWSSNTAALTFMMASNLALTANFIDTNKPSLSITNLVAGQRWSNAVFTVRGTATDNWQVASVQYRLNSLTWSNAVTTNAWTNWYATLNLSPGTNAVAAYAVDNSGNVSPTNSVNFQYVVTNQLGVRAVGLGTISPNYSNAWIELGRNYSVTSAPANGFVFTNWRVSTNWIGGATVTGTNLLFMMQSNLTLLATFVETSRPTLLITAPTNNQHMSNALATVIGTNSDNWGVSGVWYRLNSNAWNFVTATTNNYTNWTQMVTLLSGTNTVKAYAINLGGNFSLTNSVSFVSSNTFALQLVFTNAQPLKTNGLVFTLDLSTGLNGHIQVSTNLINWDTLTNFIGSNSTITFRDPGATNSNKRFYRAVIP